MKYRKKFYLNNDLINYLENICFEIGKRYHFDFDSRVCFEIGKRYHFDFDSRDMIVILCILSLMLNQNIYLQ